MDNGTQDIWAEVGNLPPVDWFLHLSLWDHRPFSWLADLTGFLFNGSQGLISSHLSWIILVLAVIVPLTLELVWWSVVWLRAKEAGYDQYKCTHWTTGDRADQLRSPIVNLNKGIVRSLSWPKLGLPLYLLAVGMLCFYTAWPNRASWTLLSLVWFVSSPLRRIASIWVARRAYLRLNPNDKLESSLRDDVYNYYWCGLSRPPQSGKQPNQSFSGDTWYGVVGNWIQRNFGRYGKFWRVFRIYNIVRFWGLLVQALVSWFWPVAAVVAPFYYMYAVADYQDWVNPWWRRYRRNEYHGIVVKGTVVSTHDEATATAASSRLR